ncbi:hypothetical protein PAPHI01_0669 [Pancytospora philotis]|nr:hypothetical protein PAPHI01_0669 [Pancytospora philotis]
MGNYLMVLSKLFGLSADATRELHGQAEKVVNAKASSDETPRHRRIYARVCKQFAARICKLLGACSVMRVSAVECNGLEAIDGMLYGSLKLVFGSQLAAGAPYLFHAELVFRPSEDVEFIYYPQPFALSDNKRANFAAAIEELPAGDDSLFSALVRGSIERFLGNGERVAPLDERTRSALASDDPLAGYAALNEWMESRPMQSLRDVLAALDHLLPAFEELLEKIRICPEGERRALLDSFVYRPLVALIDNILGALSLMMRRCGSPSSVFCAAALMRVLNFSRTFVCSRAAIRACARAPANPILNLRWLA